MDVHVVLVKIIWGEPEVGSPRLHKAQCRLAAFLHDFAELTSEDVSACSGYG